MNAWTYLGSLSLTQRSPFLQSLRVGNYSFACAKNDHYFPFAAYLAASHRDAGGQSSLQSFCYIPPSARY
jgi:hypothetical protein